jgi:hypothetical protein
MDSNLLVGVEDEDVGLDECPEEMGFNSDQDEV